MFTSYISDTLEIFFLLDSFSVNHINFIKLNILSWVFCCKFQFFFFFGWAVKIILKT